MDLVRKLPEHIMTGVQVQDAGQLYRRMQQEGLKQDTYGFVRILKNCGKSRDLVLGRQLHREIVWHGYDSNVYVGTSLVDMYAKCGCMEDAKSVFDGLTHQSDVVTWNAMIAGYVQQNQHHEALQLYAQMVDRGVSPNHRTFPFVVKACGETASSEQETVVDGQGVRLKSLEKGNALLADIQRRGYETNEFVASSLVHMFAKCGDLLRARSVLNNLPQPGDVVSWTAMIGGYVQHHQGEKAWQVYCEMQEKGVQANIMTFTNVLKACEMMAATESRTVVGDQSLKVQCFSRLEKLLADLEKCSSCELDGSISNSLVRVYAQCGDLVGARALLDRLPKCNVVAWNALIAAGCIQLQEGVDKAWQVYLDMVGSSSVQPNTWTFVSLLNACSSLAANEAVVLVDGRPTKRKTLKHVEEIHAELVRTGCDSDYWMGTTLVDLYAKCGSLDDARNVFNGLTKRDVVSWTAMISGYAQQRQPINALELYEEMKIAGEKPDNWTLVSLLKACGNMADLEDVTSIIDGQSSLKAQSLQKLKELHADVLECCGDEVDVILGTTLVDAYASCGSLADARCVFDSMSKRDVFLWTSMMEGYIELDGGEMAMQLYCDMVEEGVAVPDKWAFAAALKACANLACKEKWTLVDGEDVKVAALHRGKQVHGAMALSGCGGEAEDLIVGTTLVDMYAKCGDLAWARQMFDAMPHHDAVLWNVVMAGYVQSQQTEEALRLFSKMQVLGVNPDEATYACVLRAASDLGALRLCRQIEQEVMMTMNSAGGAACSPGLSASLINAYGKCSSMDDAQRVFDSCSPGGRNLASWNALIAGYAKQGDCASSLRWFEEMQKVGAGPPDAVTFLSVLGACCHAGMVEQGVHYFKAMLTDHGIAPGPQHYTCLVDLLGRAGLLQLVEDVVEAMHLRPDSATWLCLLRACRTYGNLEVAQRAFARAVGLGEQESSSAYILMAGVYAQHQMWEDARNTEAMGRQAGWCVDQVWGELG